MAITFTRRQILAQATIAAAVYTLDPHELCCGSSAHAQTAGTESFELKKVGDGVWAAVAAARYKVNSNAAVIETNDGLVIVDTHAKPSAAAAMYKDVQGVSKKPVKKIIYSHFHWDHTGATATASTPTSSRSTESCPRRSRALASPTRSTPPAGPMAAGGSRSPPPRLARARGPALSSD
jgi:hypothetical protein